MTCRRGHEFRGDENYRARRGWCPTCQREAHARYKKSAKGQAVNGRYDRSEKGKARHRTYNDSDKGNARVITYKQSPKGWLQALVDRRAHALKRRANRVT